MTDPVAPPLPFSIPDLREELWSLIRQVPAGSVTTFGDLAEALGERRRARWISYEFRDAPEAVPVWRVVPATGPVIEENRSRLENEGVQLIDGRVNADTPRMTDLETDAPLTKLQQLQAEMTERIRLEPLRETSGSGGIKTVAGVDLAYPEPGFAQGAYVEMRIDDGSIVHTETVRWPVPFPFVSGYLSFRELPVLWELIHRVKQTQKLAPVLMVDGSGLIHPRRAGIACHLGVLLDHPTIGVAKKLLCGQVDEENMPLREPRPVFDGSPEPEVLGVSITGRPRSKPVYVSPGHRITVEEAARLAMQTFRGHRLPEPTYLADRASRE